MRAELKYIQIYNVGSVEDEATWEPGDIASFDVQLGAWVGTPDDDTACDVFQFTACTPDQLANVYERSLDDPATSAIVELPAILVLRTWDYDALSTHLAKLCSETSGETWQSIGAQLNGTLDWEYAYTLDPEWHDST